MKMYVVRCTDAGFLADQSFEDLRQGIAELQGEDDSYWVSPSFLEKFGFDTEDDAFVRVFDIPKDDGQSKTVIEALESSGAVNGGGHSMFCVFFTEKTVVK